MKKIFQLIGFAVVVSACCLLASLVLSPDDISDQTERAGNDEKPESAISLTEPTIPPTEAPIAPPYSEIQETVEGMTEIQWKEYLPKLEGMGVENWVGWVVDVDIESGDKYKIWVDMDDPSVILSTQDVYLYGISKEEAAIITKEAQITFSGIIKATSELLGHVSITIEDVIYQIE